jgi:hypothetical protein
LNPRVWGGRRVKNASSRKHARTALGFAAFTMTALALFVALDGLLRLAPMLVGSDTPSGDESGRLG